MKIVLIYRKPHPEMYSIEELFHTIAAEMGKHAEVIQYITNGRNHILRDIINLRRLRADIYHITGDINYMASLLPRKKTVLTMHDMVHYLYTLKGIKHLVYKWFWLQIPIHLAGRTTAISPATRDDMVKHLGINIRDIEVIPNCYNKIFQPAAKSFNLKCPVIFQIGVLPHKNVPRLIEAISDIPCRMVIIGKLDDKTINLLQENKINYSNYVGITLQEIYQHYVECDFVSFISINEGFGMPIIEAQAVGRAIVTSNYSPMSIVAGDGACLVNPLDVNKIKQGILKIINDKDYREEIINNGFENIKNYTVESVASQYLDLYKDLIKNKLKKSGVHLG